MAALSTVLRDELERDSQRHLPRDSGTGFAALATQDLRAAINAIDDWADSNASAFNLAIPQPARGALNLKQKTYLLAYVIFKRAGIV